MNAEGNVHMGELSSLREWRKDAIEIVKRLCYGASLEAMVGLLRGSEESMKWLEEHDPQGALRYRTMWPRASLASLSTIAQEEMSSTPQLPETVFCERCNRNIPRTECTVVSRSASAGLPTDQLPERIHVLSHRRCNNHIFMPGKADVVNA